MIPICNCKFTLFLASIVGLLTLSGPAAAHSVAISFGVGPQQSATELANAGAPSSVTLVKKP